MKHIVLFGLFCCIAGQSLFSQYGSPSRSLLGNSIQTAIDSLEKAPVTPINLSHLGNLFSSIESYRKAEIYYQKALELDSTDLNRFKLAEISEKLKSIQKRSTCIMRFGKKTVSIICFNTVSLN
jgi:tetratricopeptide (TPR) repeat protein